MNSKTKKRAAFWQVCQLLLILDLFNQLLVIPLFRLAATFILQAMALPFVSWRNLVVILRWHWGPLLLFLLLCCCLFGLLYGQAVFLLWGWQAIRAGNFRWLKTLRLSFLSLKKTSGHSLLLFLAYLILLTSGLELFYRTLLATKLQVPDFLLDYLTRYFWLGCLLFALYVSCLYFGWRFIYALPLLVLRSKSSEAAFKMSWQRTRGNRGRKLGQKLLIIFAYTVGGQLIAALLLVGLQTVCDLFPGEYARGAAVINLTLMQLVSELALFVALDRTFSLLLRPLKTAQVRQTREETSNRFCLLLLTGLLIALSLQSNHLYLQPLRLPLTIAHRGVDNRNGVQNTIPALRKTSREKPDLVEIDVHETKDDRFIVLHDENLQKLTGVNHLPSELTLRQLTRLKAEENGRKASLVSLDHYLRVAKRVHQRLLIELKTTPHDSRQMLQHFNQQYGRLLVRRHYQVQSLDYRAVATLKRLNPHLVTIYLQAYNFSAPLSKVDGYAMEFSTINRDFISQAHASHQLVYVWTVNSPRLMRKMMYEHVDGIVTDHVALLRKESRCFKQEVTPVNYLLHYLFTVPVKSEFEP